MLLRRVIPCLDVDKGRVVKGVEFLDLRDAGDPVELAVRYQDEGADEIVFLDITASHEKRETMVELARRTADRFATAETPRFVAGSIGPSGFLPSASDPTLGNGHARQVDWRRSDDPSASTA